MKKIFTLFFALFMMVFCAKAQYLLQEGFEGSTLPTGWTIIDNDGDGYNWELTGTAEQFSTHTGNGVIVSASYDNDASTALTPDNWLITPAINITSNADLTFWVKGQDPSYASEYYSVYVATANTIAAFTATTPVASGITTGDWAQQTVNLNSYVGQNIYIAFRHHNCTDMFFLNLDDVEIFAQPTSPTISAAPATIDFGTVGMPGNKIESTIISAYSLTADITATTAAPFEVSADGTTYGTTATINQNGGTLYIKYTPTTVGIANGTVTLSSTGATSFTIALTGTALDCSNITLPYTTDFTDETLNNCWTIVDANNDGDPSSNQGMWNFMTTDGWAQYFYHSTNPANDWLISPVFYIPENGATASFDYKVRSSTYPEKFSVHIIPANGSYLNAIQVVATQTITNTTFETQYLDLNSYAGQSIQIAIKAESDENEWGLNISNFFVGTSIPTTVTVNRTSIDFGTIPAGTSMDATFIISSTNLNEAINITTSAPYEVSLDGTTYSTSVTIPANSALAVDDIVYVQFAPTTAGNYSNIVTISTTSTNDTIALTGVSVECNTITTFPFTEDFEETSLTLSCWTVNDANNDGNTFSFSNGTARYHYDSNNAADDWLISPEMTLTGSQVASFDYWAQSSYYAERFQVYAIAAGSTPTALTNAIDVTNTTAENQVVDLSSLTAGNYRIAIKCISDADMYYFNVDNFVVSDASSASLSVAPATLDFSSVVGVASIAQTVNVSGLALTEAISITAPTNFEVSSDNVTFGASATIAASSTISTQAILYVRYNPTTAGSHTGNITLTSGSASATIALTGTAIDCSSAATLPFTEDFETELTDCWVTIDNDGDGIDWYSTLGSTLTAHGGDGTYASASWTSSAGALTPDNWLITPAIAIPANGAMLSWWVAAQDPDYPSDHYQVMVSTTGTATTDFTSVYEETISSGDWTERSVALPAYANQTIRIAFVHNNCTDMFVMKIDDISVTELSSNPTVTVDPTTIDFGTIIYPGTAEETATVTAYNLTSDITITTTAPFAVSADGVTYGTSATMTQPGGTLYIQYAPTAGGNAVGIISLVSGTATASIDVMGNAIDCSAGITSLPFTHDFNDAVVPPYCWGYNNENSMGAMTIEEDVDYAAGFAAAAYLITPEIHNVTTPMNLSVDYQTLAGFNNISSSSTFRVGYSSTTSDYNSFTWLTPVVSTQMSEDFFNYTAVIPAGTKYVALDVTEIGTFTYGTSSYYNYMILDNFSLTAINNPEISANATSINFGNVNVNATATETVAVSGALLTADITATTAAPFEVSSDNTTFGATATIPAAGGNLYVRYAPTTAGNHTGNVTLASTGATSFTISLSGNAIDCSTAATLPFVEDFENGLSDCWTLIDADADGHNWEMVAAPSMSCHGGEGAIASASYDGTALTPDNWLITPAINLSGNATLTFWVVAQDASWASEHYGVYISTTGTEISNFTELYQETIDANGGSRTPGTWKQKTVNLSAYTGQNVHIAFRHFNCTDMFWLNLDDIEISLVTGIANVDNTVSIYPNPANNYINVNANSKISNVEVYTIAGQKVGDFTANGTQTVISTSELSNGLYLMRINTENGTINKKFSVVR